MRPKDRNLAAELERKLLSYHQKVRPLPGIQAAANREVFLEQLVESIRRVKYIAVISKQKHDGRRADPSSSLFDPLKAAVICGGQGQIEEAFWLVFLSVHFGKHARSGWRLARDVYGRLGNGVPWDWARTSSNPADIRKWLASHEDALREDGVARHFGNHRKYETLKAASRRWTGLVIENYIHWVGPTRSHQKLMQQTLGQAGGDPRKAFELLYHSMDSVLSFGRTARFDYLTMIGKLGLAQIKPGSAYIKDATGPLRGARLLFGGDKGARLRPSDLDAWVAQMGTALDIGMQELEDSLCNWQKSPRQLQKFRG